MERIHRLVNFFITSCIFSIRYRCFQDSQKLNLQDMNRWPRRSQAMQRRSSCLVGHSDRFDPRNSYELLYGYLCYTTHEIYVSCTLRMNMKLSKGGQKFDVMLNWLCQFVMLYHASIDVQLVVSFSMSMHDFV